jgi:hypothetical protein
MAVNSQINIKIDSSSAQRSIADLEKEFVKTNKGVRGATSELRAMREQLARMEQGTAEFEKLSREAAILQDRIGDVASRVKVLSSDTLALDQATGVITSMAGAYSVVQGGAALLGLEKENLMQIMVKLQAVQAVSNGLQQLANALNKDSAAGILLRNTYTKTLTYLTGQNTTATVASTTATKALGVAMRALPIVAIIAGITALISSLSRFNKEQEEAKKQAEEYAETQKKLKEEKDKANKSIAEQSGEFVGLITQLKTTNQNSEERLKLMKQINDTYGLTLENLSDEVAFQEQLNVAVEQYIELQKIKFRLGKNQEEINELLQRQFETDEKILKTEQEIEDNMRRTNRTRGEVLRGNSDLDKILQRLNKTKDETNARLLELGVSTLDLKVKQDELTDGGKRYEKQTNNTTESVKKLIKKKRELIDVEEELLKITIKQRQEEAKLLQEELQQELAFVDKQNTQRLTILNKQLLRELEANQGNQKKQQEIKEYYDGLAIESEIQKVNELIKIRRVYGEDVEDLLLKLSQLELNQIKDVADETKKTFEELFGNISQTANQIIGQIGQLANTIGESIRQQEENARIEREKGYDEEAARYENMLGQNLISREEYDSKMTNLDQKKEMEERAARRRAFREQKRLNISNAIMTGAQAVLGGLATQPMVPLGIIMAGIAAAASAIQINTIKGQEFRAARGGVVPGSPSNVDSVPSMLAPGEMVINSNSSSLFPELLSRINEMGGGIPLTPDVPTKTTSGGGGYVYQENREPQRVYVLENDITKSQKRITRIEDIARF